MAKDTEHIFEKLRSGVVPQRGLDTFAVGIEKTRGELARQLDLAQSGEGASKFLRGGYGCGKTFVSRLALLDAHERNFAGSFVVVSDNDLHFHKFDDVYRKVMQELSTAYCERSALGDILDRWIGQVEEAVANTGVDEESPEFEDKVATKLGDDLHARTAGKVPDDMVRALCTIFRLKQQRKYQEAGALLSWLCGSHNVDSSAKRLAGLKGDIGSKEALNYLHGVLEIVKAAGYKGLVIVIDEAETILRMRRDIRGKSLNGIRQIFDGCGGYPGLLWIFTGTPEFYDAPRGVAGLAPLSWSRWPAGSPSSCRGWPTTSGLAWTRWSAPESLLVAGAGSAGVLGRGALRGQARAHAVVWGYRPGAASGGGVGFGGLQDGPEAP